MASTISTSSILPPAVGEINIATTFPFTMMPPAVMTINAALALAMDS
jgi:hypothetical protein